MAALPYKTGGILKPFNEKPHLWSILNDPCADKLCLVVMVSTIYPHRMHDATCVLDVGDHPFIQHPSYVVYRLADTLAAPHIVSMLDQRYYLPRDDFDPAPFKRVVDGLFKSDETRGWVLKYADCVGI